MYLYETAPRDSHGEQFSKQNTDVHTIRPTTGGLDRSKAHTFSILVNRSPIFYADYILILTALLFYFVGQVGSFCNDFYYYILKLKMNQNDLMRK